ncbi:MAG: hypothetical protein D6748_14850 [Calditrichaeota bacterium]|nr:MAG: hypothetical protein D6748_14850 [Calditrichota bacterium]
MKLLLSCGPGLENKNNSHIIVVDWKSKEIIDQHESFHQVLSSSHKGFTGGHIYDKNLVVANEVEIFIYELAPLKLLFRTTNRLFNDLHYVTQIDSKFYICNTGLDTIEVFDKDFKHLQTIPLIKQFGFKFFHLCRLFSDNFKRWRNKKLNKLGYYDHLQDNIWGKNIRKLVNPLCFHNSQRDLRFHDLRPHLLHPNYLFKYNGDIWVTLWRGGGVMSLNNGRFLVKESGWPKDALHDGVLDKSTFFLTDAQNNRLLIYKQAKDSIEFQPIHRIDITDAREEGFLRGLCVTTKSIFLGLSARRNSYKWPFARVLEYDRESLQKVDEWIIPEKYGKMIYSVLDVQKYY